MAGLYDDLYSGCEEAYWLDLLYFLHRIFKLDFTTRRTAIVDKAQSAIEFVTLHVNARMRWFTRVAAAYLRIIFKTSALLA